jgi:hypothetical protein
MPVSLGNGTAENNILGVSAAQQLSAGGNLPERGLRQNVQQPNPASPELPALRADRWASETAGTECFTECASTESQTVSTTVLAP